MTIMFLWVLNIYLDKTSIKKKKINENLLRERFFLLKILIYEMVSVLSIYSQNQDEQTFK